LNGSDLNFLSCTTSTCSDGFAFATPGPGFASGSSYGNFTGGTPFVLGNYSLTPVPLETDALPIVVGAAFMAGGIWWKKKRAGAKVADFVAKK
jgi:hypothetical protein